MRAEEEVMGPNWAARLERRALSLAFLCEQRLSQPWLLRFLNISGYLSLFSVCKRYFSFVA